MYSISILNTVSSMSFSQYIKHLLVAWILLAVDVLLAVVFPDVVTL